jgi:purine catabolism regulator
LRTLKAWLDACGVADSASAALGIHRHTLRHRLERIETLTGRRLSNAHDRYGLWLAFEAREVAAAME